MRLSLDLQIATQFTPIPAASTLKRWIKSALIHAQYTHDTELTIRFVEKEEITSLNQQYRQKNTPTNVLSFPFNSVPNIPLSFLGDIIICLDVVNHESLEQKKTFYHHLTHMVIHGTLHLLGFDHIDPIDAKEMETIEIKTLEQLKIRNPYEEL